MNGADLRGAHLTNANLSEAELGRADLSGAKVQEAVFEGTFLSGANFSDADLSAARVDEAGGGKTRIVNTNFQRANLSQSGFPEEVVAGSLPVVDESSKRLSKLFIALLAALGYCLLTILKTSDLDIVTNSSSSPLPFIGVNMPIISFSIVAPIALLLVSLYFHLTLQRHWNLVARLPAKFPDGTPVDRKIHPWLLNSFSRYYFERLKGYALNRLAVSTGFLLAYYLTPVVLLFFWAWFLKRQEPWLSGLHGWLLAFGFALTAGAHAWSASMLRAGKNPSKKAAFLLPALALLLCGAAFHAGARAMINSGTRTGVLFIRSWAVLDSQDLSKRGKPPNAEDLKWAEGAKLAGAKLAKASLSAAYLAKADLRRADLRRADLSGADLSGAYLSGADLIGANLLLADLRGANLFMANLNRANLTGANLTGADLSFADLREANLIFADLSGADLTGVKNWEEILDITHAVIHDLKGSPPGFLEWAKKAGAIVMDPESMEER
ncbi:MAG: pentapeptide repeat-containing protein [Acidobacteriota bacterium]